MSDEPRWLADEMLGRLARYLRFLGFDTAYARGLTAAQILERAQREERTLLTRNVRLAKRCTPSFLLKSTALDDQLASLRAAFPEISWEVSFDRCTLCNGLLAPRAPGAVPLAPESLPGRVRAGWAVYECPDCGHLFWEGSHTESVRRAVQGWFGPVGPG